MRRQKKLKWIAVGDSWLCRGRDFSGWVGRRGIWWTSVAKIGRGFCGGGRFLEAKQAKESLSSLYKMQAQ